MPQKTKFVKILAGIIALYLGFTFIRNSYLLWQAGSRVDQAKDQLEAAQKERRDLTNQLHQINSPEFIEKEARDKLGLAKPGEIVVILPPEDQLRKIAPDLSVKPEVSPPNWQQWLALFLSD